MPQQLYLHGERPRLVRDTWNPAQGSLLNERPRRNIFSTVWKEIIETGYHCSCARINLLIVLSRRSILDSNEAIFLSLILFDKFLSSLVIEFLCRSETLLVKDTGPKKRWRFKLFGHAIPNVTRPTANVNNIAAKLNGDTHIIMTRMR
mmetsp:Transcript_29694/g.45424  ORF Transcript_29694/g.45424 Transcript_29694/m.45424 type:complete len:148 (-) Transcript_29694:2129-2572(-)